MKALPVYKTNHQSQLNLLPPDYDSFIPSQHPVRAINTNIVKLVLYQLYFEFTVKENNDFFLCMN